MPARKVGVTLVGVVASLSQQGLGLLLLLQVQAALNIEQELRFRLRAFILLRVLAFENRLPRLLARAGFQRELSREGRATL